MAWFVPLITAAVGAGVAIWQTEEAKKQARKAEQARGAIQAEDPEMRGLLNSMRQKQLYAEAGATKMSALKRRLAEDSAAQTQANLARGAGGSSGSYIDSILRSQNLTQRSLMQGAAETEQMSDRYLSAQSPIISDMADRRHSLRTDEFDRRSGQAAAGQQNASSNINAALGLLASMDWGGGKSAQPQPAGASGIQSSASIQAMDASKYNDISSGYAGLGTGY